jgi:hypothetical protein
MLALEGMMNAKEAAKASEMAGEEIDRLGDPLATDEERQSCQRGRTMSGEFSSLDARERAALEAALKRCCVLADQIERELRNKRPDHFVDVLSLADIYASLERAADVLRQKSRQPVGNTPAPAVKGSQARGRQRQR